MLDLFFIMNTSMLLGIDFMIQPSEAWKRCGHTTVQNEDVNSPNTSVNELHHGCGCAKPVTTSTLENEEQTVVSDAGHVQPYSST